jgi:hypothetical protein
MNDKQAYKQYLKSVKTTSIITEKRKPSFFRALLGLAQLTVIILTPLLIVFAGFAFVFSLFF